MSSSDAPGGKARPSSRCRSRHGRGGAGRRVGEAARRRLTLAGGWWKVADVPAAADRIFALSPDFIVIAGLDGRFRRVNPAFESSLGYAEEDLVGRPVLDTAHPDDRSPPRA